MAGGEAGRRGFREVDVAIKGRQAKPFQCNCPIFHYDGGPWIYAYDKIQNN